MSAILDKLAGVAGLVCAVTLLYLIYGLFSAEVRGYEGLLHDGRLRVLQNVGVASTAFRVAGFILVAYLTLRLWEQKELAVGLALGGAAFYWGIPILLTGTLGAWVQQVRPAGMIQGAFTSVGQMLLLAAAVRGVPALVEQLRTGFKGVGEESATRRVARQQQPGVVHPLSACWRLPYCRPFIRENCVRYKERKTCWRVKGGCMCDDDIMAAALIGGGPAGASTREKLLTEFLPGAAAKGTGARRLKCQNCFIFLEHQRIKHKYVAPLAIPALLFAFWHYWEGIHGAYQGLGTGIASVVQRAALGEVDTSTLVSTFTNPMMEALILACAAIYTLTYVLHFLEYLFFKLKI